jgi:hypothetical protein
MKNAAHHCNASWQRHPDIANPFARRRRLAAELQPSETAAQAPTASPRPSACCIAWAWMKLGATILYRHRMSQAQHRSHKSRHAIAPLPACGPFPSRPNREASTHCKASHSPPPSGVTRRGIRADGAA